MLSAFVGDNGLINHNAWIILLKLCWLMPVWFWIGILIKLEKGTAQEIWWCTLGWSWIKNSVWSRIWKQLSIRKVGLLSLVLMMSQVVWNFSKCYDMQEINLCQTMSMPCCCLPILPLGISADLFRLYIRKEMPGIGMGLEQPCYTLW